MTLFVVPPSECADNNLLVCFVCLFATAPFTALFDTVCETLLDGLSELSHAFGSKVACPKFIVVVFATFNSISIGGSQLGECLSIVITLLLWILLSYPQLHLLWSALYFCGYKYC